VIVPHPDLKVNHKGMGGIEDMAMSTPGSISQLRILSEQYNRSLQAIVAHARRA